MKELVEEIAPIGIFARTFEAPERRVTCRYRGRSTDEVDGEMRLSGASIAHGFCEPEYFLEVTTAEPVYAYLQREALARYGGVFSDPGIRRVGSIHHKESYIESEPFVSDAGAGVANMVCLVRKAIEAKLERNYPQPCILLVRVEPGSILSFHDWCLVAKKAVVPAAREQFAAVYLVYTSSALSVPVN